MDFQNSGLYNGKAIQEEEEDSGTSGKVNSWPNSVCFGKKELINGRNSMSSSSNVPTKRHRSSCQNSQTSRCQVEGCNVDLSTAKGYHRRHRICECHSKSPRVIVAGMERRFCQQCSRFHHLEEFDDQKRSCRRRLSDHNARRRRPHPEALHLNSTGLTSSLNDRRPPSFLLNRLASSVTNTTWESSCSLKMTPVGSPLIRDSGNGSSSSSAASSYLSEARPNLPRALSLLSATANWGRNNQPETTSLDPFFPGTESLTQPVMALESQNWPFISGEQAHSISYLQ